MSYFAVTIETIGSIEPIPNADRIVKATLKGLDFSFVVQKNQFQVGDKCLYIPLDAIIPLAIQEKIGLVGKLAGKEKNRVRTVKLKGTHSQGIATDLKLIEELLKTNSKPTPEEITTFLGITKYEPEVEELKISWQTDTMGPQFRKGWPWYKKLIFRIFGRKWVQKLFGRTPGTLVPLNSIGVSVYDLESIQRYKDIADEHLLNEKVFIQEKIEGQNRAVLNISDKIYMCQRRFFIEESKTDDKWELARQYKLIDFVKWLTKQTGSKHTGVYFEGAGEGIQGNIYQIKGVRPFIFDVVVDDHFVSKKQMVEYVETFFGNRDLLAPILAEGVLFKDWLNNKTYADAADGKSMLFDTLREGYVVSLWDCVKTNPKLGRIILKFRSKEYLAKHDT